MSSKRKRESVEAQSTPVPSKLARQNEVTRSGRMRKKPAKFSSPEDDQDVSLSADKVAMKAQSEEFSSVPGIKTESGEQPGVTTVYTASAPDHDIPSAVGKTTVKTESDEWEDYPTEYTTQGLETSPAEGTLEPMTSPLGDEFHYDDEDSGRTPGRSGRMRKKSAKVLEMEEFEEAEKKQFRKKPAGDASKKASATKGPPKAPYLAVKMKTSTVTASAPVTAALAAKLLSSTQGLSNTSVPGVAQGSAGVTVQALGCAITAGDTDVKSAALHQKVGTSKAPQVMAAVQSPQKSVGEVVTPDGSLQTVKVEGEQGSVIKLLLSSPAQNTGPTLSTRTVTSASPSQETSSGSVSKKAKAKGKTLSSPESASALVMSSPEKQDMSKLKLALGVTPPEPMSQVKIESLDADAGLSLLPAATQGQDPMKMKFILSPKQESMDQYDDSTELSPTLKKEKKESKAKKPKKVTKESKSQKLSSPGSPPVTVSVNLDADVQKKKKPSKVKQEEVETGYIEEEFGLDLEEIPLAEPGEESLMDMEESDSLMISEESFEPMKTKPKLAKKKLKLSKDASQADVAEGDLVMDFERMKRIRKPSKKRMVEPQPVELEKGKKKRAPTAYMIWCNAHRPKLVKDNPKIDFSTISKRLGEMWSALSDKEKMVWKRKAKKAAGKGSTLITTGRGTSGSSKLAPSAGQEGAVAGVTGVSSSAVKSPPGTGAAVVKSSRPGGEEGMQVTTKAFGIEPVDVASHLRILGESLSLIGNRLTEHRGQIAVQGSLSVLLDSLLCACAPLMCLTAQLPETNGCSYTTHMKTLGNIGYIMPGL